jgi:hypothetical protein
MSQNKSCYCALCRTPRRVRYSRRLSFMHLTQILFLSALSSWALFPLIQAKALLSIFVIWASYEFIRLSLYRRSLVCETCGFDPTWYKRDVRIARRLVEEHLKHNTFIPQKIQSSATETDTYSKFNRN